MKIKKTISEEFIEKHCTFTTIFLLRILIVCNLFFLMKIKIFQNRLSAGSTVCLGKSNLFQTEVILSILVFSQKNPHVITFRYF